MTDKHTTATAPDLGQVALLYDNNRTPFMLMSDIAGNAVIKYANAAMYALYDKPLGSLVDCNASVVLDIGSCSIASSITAAFDGEKRTTYADILSIQKYCELDFVPLGASYCGCMIQEIDSVSSNDERHWLRTYYRKVLELISTVVDVRSAEVGAHICRMRGYTETLCRAAVPFYPELVIDERMILAISEASVLHDVGKIGIADSILLKPATLTGDEFEEMKQHTEIGGRIAKHLADFAIDLDIESYAYDICRYHHERFDGNGYPDRLAGDNIPFCSQVVAIADAYDALTTSRVYKPAFSPEHAYEMIKNGDCGVFSPRMLKCLESVKDEFALIARSYAED